MFNVLEHRFSVTCGMLHVKCNTYDMSHITFHVSYVTGHRSGHFLGQETNIKSIEYKQDYVKYAEMAKNDHFWPKIMEDNPSGWNKLLLDHPYTIPNDFTIEYKQVYAENLLKSCWNPVEMTIFGHFWPFFGT